jgi:hypothetical protein
MIPHQCHSHDILLPTEQFAGKINRSSRMGVEVSGWSIVILIAHNLAPDLIPVIPKSSFSKHLKRKAGMDENDRHQIQQG